MHSKNAILLSFSAVLCCSLIGLILWRFGSDSHHIDKQKPDASASLIISDAPAIAKVATNLPIPNNIATNSKHRMGSMAFAKSLPPDDMPWQQMYGALRARSENGDAAAASRLFQDTLRCKTYLSIKKNLDLALNAYSNTQVPEQVLRNYDKKLADLENRIKKSAPICSGVDPEELNAATEPVLRQAASLGNEMAANCYVDGSIFQQDGATTDQLQAAKADYAKHALQFVSNAIESGDWAMVSLLELAYGNTPPQYGGRGWLGALVKPDPLTMYAYMLLDQNGRDSAAAARVEPTLAGIREANHFSPVEIAAAQSWANNVYAQYFAGHPYPEGDSTTICGLQ